MKYREQVQVPFTITVYMFMYGIQVQIYFTITSIVYRLLEVKVYFSGTNTVHTVHTGTCTVYMYKFSWQLQEHCTGSSMVCMY